MLDRLQEVAVPARNNAWQRVCCFMGSCLYLNAYNCKAGTPNVCSTALGLRNRSFNVMTGRDYAI
jgi:hypothetical protein